MARLKDNGYEYYQSDCFTNWESYRTSFSALREGFRDLRPDPYGKEHNRYRAYDRGIYLPWDNHFHWCAPFLDEDQKRYTKFYNGKFNPEFPNLWRQFPALSEEIRANQLLVDLINFDIRQIEIQDHFHGFPIYVGIAFIKLQVTQVSQKAYSTPDCLHCDGEYFTFVHLANRQNVTGGDNCIAEVMAAGKRPDEINQSQILAEFELYQPLDSYAVQDDKVSHYVSPISQQKSGPPAERSVILIDFTPMVPAHHVTSN